MRLFRRRRYVVRREPFPGDWPYRVVDRETDRLVWTYRSRAAARNRARVLNANVPTLAESKGWRA